MLVLDASAAVAASLSKDGWEPMEGQELVAPFLMFSEACSALHEAQWRRELAPDEAAAALARLKAAPVVTRSVSLEEVWRVAEELGWAKTYDAEYVALARDLRCRLLSLDDRLRRGVRGMVEVIGPADL
jgi:indolepyruvate ferredoxin oxidoreductase alpha subunit